MKLYAIRIENGDVIVVSAESEQHALFEAGLDESIMDEIRQQGLDHAALVQSGFAPQRYEITELKHFCIRMKPDKLGIFEVKEVGEETDHELDKLYPIMEAACSEACSRWPNLEDIQEHHDEYLQLITDAHKRELMRLMMPPGSE